MYWLAFLLSAVVGFFLSPFVVRHLGATAYGAWALLGSLIGYLGLLDFGVRGTVTRYVAHRYASRDSEGSSALVSAGLVMFALLGTLAILLSASLALLSPKLFNIPAPLIADTRTILVIGGFTTAITFIGAVFGGVVAGLERFDISSGIEIIVTAVRTGAIVLALSTGYGIVALSFIHLASSAAQGITTWMAVRRLYPELRIRFKASLWEHMRTILTFSMFLSALHIFSAVIYYSDSLIIAAFLPIGAVTYFAIAANLCEYARQAAAALSMMITPRVSALTAAGSSQVGDAILGSARLATLLSAPIAMTFLIRGESFVNLWMGTEYGTTSGAILRILAFVVMLGGARAVATASIIGVNRHRTLLPCFAIEAACNVATSALLVGPFGLNGVALGTLIPNLVASLGYIPGLLSAATGVSPYRFRLIAWILPIAASLPFAAVSFLLEHWLPATNLLNFFAQVLLSLPVVAVGAFVVCLNQVEKVSALAMIRRLAGARDGSA